MIRKEPLQLDLFVPYEYGYEFKVIVTNKWASGKKVLMYHNGRAAQGSVLGELKSQSQMDYIAVRGLLGNQLFMLAAILSHNLNRELQMATRVPDRGTSEKRTPLWFFESVFVLSTNALLFSVHLIAFLARPSGYQLHRLGDSPSLPTVRRSHSPTARQSPTKKYISRGDLRERREKS
jgi:hypothetical protein